MVAQNHEEPSFEVGTRLKARATLPRLDERFLAQVVGLFTIARKRSCKRSHKRNQADQAVAKRCFDARFRRRCTWVVRISYHREISILRHTADLLDELQEVGRYWLCGHTIEHSLQTCANYAAAMLEFVQRFRCQILPAQMLRTRFARPQLRMAQVFRH
jgi:hypothetical protein